MPKTRRPSKRATRSPSAGLRRLPLGSLRVFVAVAEELSFTRAALALGVSVGAVSMQIRALEEYLRTPLFRRRGRLVHLTADAAKLYARIVQAAKLVCAPEDYRLLLQVEGTRDCVRATVDATVAHVAMPQLTAYHLVQSALHG